MRRTRTLSSGLRGLSRVSRPALVSAAVIGTVATSLAAPSYAVTRSWNSGSNPLILRVDGHDKGRAYGTWQIGTTSNGTRSQAYGYLKDDDANGHAVFWEMYTYLNSGYCVAPDFVQCDKKYFSWDKQFSNFDKETWDKNYWSPSFYASTSVSGEADTARVGVRVGESNDGPDNHTGWTWTKGNKY